MDKQKRTKIKKRGKRQYWIAFGLVIFAILYLILMFTTPLADVIRNVGQQNDFWMVVVVSLAVSLVIVPLFGSLIYSKKGEWTLQELREYKMELWEEQNKFHAKLFWEAIQVKDFETAKKYYNIDKFIFGSMRVLCNGILMGIATERPIDEDWSEKVTDRMNSYLK